MRVATIDIGTNTVLLLVAERRSDGLLVPVEERATITRLGEGVDKTRTLAPAAIDRTKACLDAYADIVRAQRVEKIAVVGTSAMRDAGGGDIIRAHVKERLGVEARTISGDEEARLTFKGALSGLPLGDAKRVQVFDIGGGSTEVVQGDRAMGSIAFAKSYDVGSVRLTERHVKSDPPLAAELAAVRDAARAAFAPVPAFDADAPPIGIAGTVTTLAAIAQSMTTYDAARVHGSSLDVETLERIVARLAALPLAARRDVPGLEPKRADVIIAGALVVLAFLAQTKATTMIVSDRGVRWGLAEELV